MALTHTESAERFRRLTDTSCLHSGLAARSARAGAITAVFSFTDFAVRIGSTAVLARLVLPEHFGLVMMVTAITAIADQLRDMGLSVATIQRTDITHAEITNLFWINTAVGSLLALIICALSPAVSLFYHDPRLTPIMCLLSTGLIFGGLTVQHEALLARNLRMGRAGAVRLGSNVLSTVLAIALAAAGLGYWSLVWREVARAAFIVIGVWFCMPWTPGLPSRETDVRGLLKFGAHLTAGNLFGTLISATDRILLGRYFGPGDVAMYRQAFQLISASTDQVLSPLYQVTQPGLSLLQSDPNRYRRFYTRVVTMVSLVTMPLSLFVAIYAREITLVLLGPRWLESVLLLRILCLGTFIKQATSSSMFVPITRGHGATYLGLSVLQYSAMAGLMAIGVHWGTIGIAVAYVGSIYIVIPPRLYYSFSRSPISARNFFAALARPATASVAMASGIAVMHQYASIASAPSALVLGFAVGALIFAGTWLGLPGGCLESRAVATDLLLAFRKQKPTNGTPPSIEVGNRLIVEERVAAAAPEIVTLERAPLNARDRATP